MFEREFFHFKFPQHLKDNTAHISQLELFTLYISVRLWAPRLAGKVIRITTDNQATMWVVNLGRTTDKFMLQCTQRNILDHLKISIHH